MDGIPSRFAVENYGIHPGLHYLDTMKTPHFFAIAVAFLTAWIMLVASAVYASDVATNFARWVPDFAASNLDTRKDAQQNWQRFCQQQGHIPENQREIIRVSAEQLANANPVDTSVWIIRQLGTVGDATAVPALAGLLTHSEVRIRDEAARALANIPFQEAEDALKANSQIVAMQLAQDALAARTQSAGIPRADGVESVMPMAIPFLPLTLNANPDISAFLEEYSQLNDMEKAQVLSNLTDRILRIQLSVRASHLPEIDKEPVQPGQGFRRPASPGVRGQSNAMSLSAVFGLSAYLPLAVEAVESSDETLRRAGILAVSALGSQEEIPILLEQTRDRRYADLATLALSRMSGSGVDAALLEKLKTETDAETFIVLADVLHRRFNTEIKSILLERAKNPDSQNRLRLLEWAESASSIEDIPDFVATWKIITSREDKDRVEQIIARLSDGRAAPVLQALGNDWDTPEGLSLLGRIGDSSILDDTIRPSRHSVHAFRTWPNAVVADDLIAFVRNASNPDGDRISALRAFIRVVSLPGTRPQDPVGIRISNTEKLDRLIEAFNLASRDEERRLAIERAGSIRIVESLRFAMQHIDNPELQERACWAILQLAHQTNLRRSARIEFHEALDKVIEVTPNNDYRNRAIGYKAAR